MDVFAKLGVAESETDSKSISDPEMIEIDESVDLSWAIGIKRIIYKLPKGFDLGGLVEFGMKGNDARAYNRTDKRYSPEAWVIQDETFTGATNATHRGKQKTNTWKVRLSIGKQIKQFFPYGGIQYSDRTTRLTDRTTGLNDSGAVVGIFQQRLKFRAEDRIGPFLGTDYDLTDKMSLNVEGRFGAHESSVRVGIAYKFVKRAK